MCTRQTVILVAVLRNYGFVGKWILETVGVTHLGNIIKKEGMEKRGVGQIEKT